MNHESGSPPAFTKTMAMIATDFRTNDFDEIRARMSGWNQRFDQLDLGRFEGRLAFAASPSIQLFSVESNRVIRSTGGCPPDSFLITPVTTTIAGSRWRGRLLMPGMVNVLESSSEMDHLTCPNYRQSSFLVSREAMERVAQAVVGVGCERFLCGKRVLQIGPATTASLTQQFESTLAGWIRVAAHQPASTSLSMDELIAAVAITLAEGRVEDPFRTTSTQRKSVVRRIEEHVRANPGLWPGIVELCQLAGVSKRTLHYAFLEVTGCSPHDFIKAIKLNAARRDLKASPPGKGQIERVARSHGFSRPGSFAADFRSRFARLPSGFLSLDFRG